MSNNKKTKKLTLSDLKKAVGGATPIKYEVGPAGDESWIGKVTLVPGGRGSIPQAQVEAELLPKASGVRLKK